MDLSHSGMFEKVKAAFHVQNRGGYRQWFNPVYADPNKNTRLRPTKTNAMLFAEDKDEDDEDLMPMDDDDDDENDMVDGSAAQKSKKNTRGVDDVDEAEGDGNDNPIDPSLRTPAARAQSRVAPRAPSKAADRAPSAMPQSTEDLQKQQPTRLRNTGEIQVLDLHSDNPIITYKGRIFSGTWASNIGSELIFGAHDEVADRGLPHLRALPEGVDLMAASSARILTTPVDLRPKNRGGVDGSGTPVLPGQPGRKPAVDRYRNMRKESGIEIPIAFDKHGRRKPQARFLENLMAIKRSRGEQDEVTTVTKDTTRDYVNKDDDPEEASLQKKRARDRRRQQRLMEERASRPRTKRRGGNRWLKDQMVSFTQRESAGGRVLQGGEGGTVLSTKTPATWGEMDGAEGSRDQDEEVGGIAEGGHGNAAEDTIMESG